MKNLKLSLGITLCLLALRGASGLDYFTAWGNYDYGTYDTHPYHSADYDISVYYRNSSTGTQLHSFLGWRYDLPIDGAGTGLPDYILEGDSATYAAQWDSSATQRTNWDPATANVVIYY